MTLTKPERRLQQSHDAASVSARRVFALRQGARLFIGVGGTLGGALLLATNLLGVVGAGAGALPWVPLSANVGLLFGGVMFLREYRRASLEHNRSTAV